MLHLRDERQGETCTIVTEGAVLAGILMPGILPITEWACQGCGHSRQATEVDKLEVRSMN